MTSEAPAKVTGIKRVVLFGLRAFIACGLLLICFEIAVHIHPPTLSWGWL